MTTQQERPRAHGTALKTTPTTVTDSTRIPDWARCLICRQPGRNGVIHHGPSCPQWRPPQRRSASVHTGRSAASADDPQGRYRRFRALLGEERRRDRFDCPVCGARGDGRGLKVDFDGQRIKFVCFECGGRDVLRALRITSGWLDGSDSAW